MIDQSYGTTSIVLGLNCVCFAPRDLEMGAKYQQHFLINVQNIV